MPDDYKPTEAEMDEHDREKYGDRVEVTYVDYGLREFELPVRVEGVLKAMTADRAISRSKCTPEQAARVAWRIALDWLKAQSALIDAELASLDEVMMPYMVDGKGQTMYSVYRSTQKAIEG